jgi:hypothetical protein
MKNKSNIVGFEVFTGVAMKSIIFLLACLLAELFFDTEDGGVTFLGNFGYNSTDYRASYARRRYSSRVTLFSIKVIQYINIYD